MMRVHEREGLFNDDIEMARVDTKEVLTLSLDSY